MDLTIFLLSVVLLFFARKIEWSIIGLLILSSEYLGIGTFFEEQELNYFEPKDLALILLFIILFIVPIKYVSVFKATEIKRLNNYIVIFLIYILLSIGVDFIMNGIDLWSVLRTSRHWLFLLIFVPLMYISSNRLERVIRILYYLTIGVSLIIVFEYISDLHYFTGEIKMSFEGVERGALPSTYALFYVLLVALGYGNHPRVIKYIILTLLTFSLLLSATKSIALGLFLGFVILMFLKSKSIWSAIGGILLVTFLALSVIIIMPNLRTRLIYGQQNFGSVEDGSTTFRKELAEERFHYISQNPLTLVLGIGNITEDNFKGNFNVGHISDEGQQAQLDTGDIAWALLFLRLGLLGTILWIVLTIVFVWCFIRRKKELYSIPVISYLLLNLLVLSFAGTTIYTASYWIVPLICINIVFQKNICYNESRTY